MAAAIIGVNVKLEVQSALGSPKTMTDITVATDGTTTVASTAHGFSNGDIVVLTLTSGMDQLDGQAARVANKSNDAFELEGIDATDYDDFVSGTVTKVTSFVTFAKAQTISAPNPPAVKIPITTLLDVVEKNVFGIPGAPDGSVGALFNPGGATEAIIAAATATNTPLVLKITYADSRKTLVNAYVSGGSGFDLQQNQAAKSQMSWTEIGRMLHYAT